MSKRLNNDMKKYELKKVMNELNKDIYERMNVKFVAKKNSFKKIDIFEKPKIIYAYKEKDEKDVIINAVKKSLEKLKNNENSEEIWNEFKETIFKYEKESIDNKLRINAKELYELIDIFSEKIENFENIINEAIQDSSLMRTLVDQYIIYYEKYINIWDS